MSSSMELKVYHRVNMSPSLNKINPVHNVITHVFKIYFTVVTEVLVGEIFKPRAKSCPALDTVHTYIHTQSSSVRPLR